MKEGNQKVGRVNHQSIILILVFVIGAGILFLLQTKDSSFKLSGNPRIEKGGLAPNFTFSDLEGKMISLTDYKGKVVLLNIWATWCSPCVAEMPSMEKLHQELKGEAFVILAVSIDVSGVESVSPFVKHHKLNFPVLIDTAGVIKNLYQATGVPESFIIGKDGVIIEKVIGPRDWASADAVRYFRNLTQSN